MQVKLEVLSKGDSVLNVWDNNIAIAKKNGDVEILHYELGENGLPTISNHSILITHGDGIVRMRSDDSPIEVGTF